MTYAEIAEISGSGKGLDTLQAQDVARIAHWIRCQVSFRVRLRKHNMFGMLHTFIVIVLTPKYTKIQQVLLLPITDSMFTA